MTHPIFMLKNLTIDVEKKDQAGKTALHYAAKSNDLSLVKKLLSEEAKVDERDDEKRTPLHEAARSNEDESHFEVIDMLLKNGADVNAQDRFNLTPLWFLVESGNVKIIQLVLDFKADVNVTDDRGQNLLSRAAYYNDNVEVAQFLIDLGFNVNSVDEKGATPLHMTCRAPFSKNIKMIKCLLRNGADVNALDKNQHTPMIEEIRSNVNEKNLNFMKEHTDFSTDKGDRILTFFKNVPDFLKRMIIGHLAILLSLNLPVHENILDTISKKNELNEYFKQCEEELLRAKNTKLESSWITFYDLLVYRRRKLKNYGGNKDLCTEVKHSNCEKLFPIYGEAIDENIRKGIHRRELFDRSAVVLSNCLPMFNPNHLVIRNILDCMLGKKDLSKLCE